MADKDELPIMMFVSAAQWEEWLAAQHAESSGVWLRIAKKGSGIASVTYDGALDVALCFGWIDGQRKTGDATSFLQKFTPRRPKGLWSQRNVEKIAALTAAGKMRPAGLVEVESAQRDGRWEAAYASPKNMELPADFLAAVRANGRASAFFDTLNRTNRYSLAWRLATARKPETRQRRFDALLAMLERGETFH